MRALFLVCLMALLLLPTARIAFAEEEFGLKNAPGFLVSSPTNVSKDLIFDGNISYIEDSDFSGGLGSVEVARLNLSADYSIFNLSYGYSHFNWRRKSDVTFPSSDGSVPWEGLHDVTLQGRLLNNSLGEGWIYWLNGQISASFETDFPGAVGVGFDGGVAYDLYEGWMIGVTARTVALSALRDDLFGERDFGLAVAVSQKALRTFLREVGISQKEGGSEDIGFSFAFTSSEKTYRLSPDSPVAQNGYLTIVYSKLGGYLDYTLDDKWIFSIGPEFYYDREYQIYNSKARSGGTYRLDNGWGGYFRVLYKF